jgi:hypothetical protein
MPVLSILLLWHFGQDRSLSSEGPFGDGMVNLFWQSWQTYSQAGGPGGCFVSFSSFGFAISLSSVI